MKKNTPRSGFTLLELIIVITIIGIFIAIALSYLGQSREKGGDATIKSNLVNARSQAEVFFANADGSYEGVCLAASTDGIRRHVQGAMRAYGADPKSGEYADGTSSTGVTEECHDSVDAYAVWVPLSGSTVASPRAWCIDSRNNSKLETGVGNVLAAGATQCP